MTDESKEPRLAFIAFERCACAEARWQSYTISNIYPCFTNHRIFRFLSIMAAYLRPTAACTRLRYLR